MKKATDLARAVRILTMGRVPVVVARVEGWFSVKLEGKKAWAQLMLGGALHPG